MSQSLTGQLIELIIRAGGSNGLKIPTGVENCVFNRSLLSKQPNFSVGQETLQLKGFRETRVSPYCCGECVKV